MRQSILVVYGVAGVKCLTSGLWQDPGDGTVDVQRTTIEDLGETGSHLQKPHP